MTSHSIRNALRNIRRLIKMRKILYPLYGDEEDDDIGDEDF